MLLALLLLAAYTNEVDVTASRAHASSAAGRVPAVKGVLSGQSNMVHQGDSVNYTYLRNNTSVPDHVQEFVTVAYNSTSLNQHWKEGASGSGHFEELVYQLRLTSGSSFNVFGIGETDANAQTRADAFYGNFTAFVADIERASGFRGLWVVVYLNKGYTGGAFGATVRAAQEQVVSESMQGVGVAPGRMVSVNPDRLTVASGDYGGAHYVFPQGRIALAQLIEARLASFYGWDL